MAKSKSFIPEGFNTVSPYLIVDGAQELIDFLTKGLDGKQIFSMKDDSGKITHATVKIGNSMIMLGDTMRGMGPQTAMLYLYVEDVDNLYKKALQAKAENVREPKDEFYGDRSAAVKDRWGNTWWIATQKEDVDRPELERRAKEMYKKRKDEVPTH